jgi:hypothetical protein
MDRTRWLALPLSALLLAACGSSGGDKLSKSDLIAKADKICSDASKQVKALKPPNPRDSGQVQKATSSAAKLAQDAAGKLKDLTPPDSVKADYDTFTTSVSTQADQANTLADALKKKDKAKIRSVFSELQQGASKARTSAQKVGLKKCGSGS